MKNCSKKMRPVGAVRQPVSNGVSAPQVIIGNTCVSRVNPKRGGQRGADPVNSRIIAVVANLNSNLSERIVTDRLTDRYEKRR